MVIRKASAVGFVAALSLALVIILPSPGFTHVVENWDWHLLDNGEKKRHLHWCVVFQLRPGMQDAFPRDQADQWKGWAREAFDNWKRDRSGEATGWTFEEVDFWDTRCQVQIRWSVTPRSDYGRTSVPTGEEGDQRAQNVQIYIHGVDAEGRSRSFGREGENNLDPVRLLKHEVGHAIRLDDTENREDIMSSGVETEESEKGNHNTNLSDEDYREAKASARGELKVAMGPSVGQDVGALVAAVPRGPMVEAYIAMAVEASDRYGDLDAAHDWLERALELEPDNRIAGQMLANVEEAQQQVGIQRAGVALGVLQQMLIEQALREEERREHGEGEHGELHYHGGQPCTTKH